MSTISGHCILNGSTKFDPFSSDYLANSAAFENCSYGDYSSSLFGSNFGSASDDCRLVMDQSQIGGLIVCYGFYAEFIGPGAIAYSPSEAPYTQIFALGSPLLLPLTDSATTVRAYRQRSHWVKWLGRIAGMQEPMDRCRCLLQGLEGLFSLGAIKEVPDSVLAMLVGVLPTTMARVRREYRKKGLIPVNPKPRTGYYAQSGVRGNTGDATGDARGDTARTAPRHRQNQLSVTGVLHVNAKDQVFRAIA
ncbi:MAG: hypothetical protein ACFCBU_09675 [Cyanophyceae cyanobacterium]